MTISATELRQKSHLMEEAKREDIIVTKRERPFAVIVDIDRYYELLQRAGENDGKESDREEILRRSVGILRLQRDPVAWQEELRRESERDPYGRSGM
jgi:prevent-host-death family protein